MPKLSRSAWKAKRNWRRRRIKELRRLIAAVSAEGIAVNEATSLSDLRREMEATVAELDKLEVIGIRYSYTYDGGAANAARNRYGELASKTTETIETYLRDTETELSKTTPIADQVRSKRELESIRKGLVQELIIREPRTKHRKDTWRRWYKGPGKVRFWRG